MKIEKVLVVDDSKVAHLNLRKLLTERGVEVDWVGSGEDCLTYLRRQKPDVVFMDVMMPGMDGFDTTSVINSDPTIDSPPVVICSANATDEDRLNAEKNGAIDFLSKPYTAEKLDQILAKVIEQRSAIVKIDEVNADTAKPTTAPPEPEKPSVSTVEKAVASTAEAAATTAAAEQVARATAEEVARKMVGDLIRLAAERTIRLAVKEAESVARETASHVAGETAHAAAEHTAQVIAEKVACEVGERVATQVAVAAEVRVVDSIRMREELQAQIPGHLPEMLDTVLASEDFKRRLARLVEETARPLVEFGAHEAAQAARQAAAQLLDERAQSRGDDNQGGGKAALLRSNLALAASVIAMIAVAALRFLG